MDFELEWNGEARPLAPGETEELFTRTSDSWQGWVSQSRYRGRWREMVQRSALVLKLLVYHPTGALVAAPTTSLPEELGGGRNWDYRYSWLRDAAFTVYALMTLGFLEEAASFMEWVQHRCETATRERDVTDHAHGGRGRGHPRGGPGSPRRLPGVAAGCDCSACSTPGRGGYFSLWCRGSGRPKQRGGADDI